MSEKLTVDRADLEDVYVQMDDELAKTRMRRIFHDSAEQPFDHDTEDAVEQARAEGFAAGMLMATMAQTGMFAEDAAEDPATEEEAQKHLNPQFENTVIEIPWDGSPEDLYVALDFDTDVQTRIEETDMPTGWTGEPQDVMTRLTSTGQSSEP